MPSPEARIGPMTLGLVLPTFPQHSTGGWDTVGAVAAGAERAGASAVWVCDHLFWPTPNLDCGVALTVAALATERCLVGTAVVQMPLRQPASVAKMASSVQVVSRGRVVLGVGVGEHPGEYAAADVPFRRRGAALDRAIGELRAWWAGAGADGERYVMRPAADEIPIWVGGRSDAARRRAATLGDGWMPLFVSPGRLRESYEHLAKEAEAAGREPAEVVPSAMVFVDCDGRSPVDSRGTAWLSSLYGLPPERFDRHLVSGPPDHCAEMLARFAEAGTEHLALFITSDEPLTSFQAITATLGSGTDRRH